MSSHRGSSPRRAIALAVVLASSFGVLISVALIDPSSERPVAVTSAGSVARQAPVIVAPPTRSAPTSIAATPRPGQQLVAARPARHATAVTATGATTNHGAATGPRVQTARAKKVAGKNGSHTPVSRTPVHRSPVSNPRHPVPSHPAPTRPTPVHSVPSRPTPTHTTPTHTAPTYTAPPTHNVTSPSSQLAALLAERDRQLRAFLAQQQSWLQAQQHQHYGSPFQPRSTESHATWPDQRHLRDHSGSRS